MFWINALSEDFTLTIAFVEALDVASVFAYLVFGVKVWCWFLAAGFAAIVESIWIKAGVHFFVSAAFVILLDALGTASFLAFAKFAIVSLVHALAFSLAELLLISAALGLSALTYLHYILRHYSYIWFRTSP